MKMNETPLVFTSENKRLVGIIHKPVKATNQGMLLIVGGPQTRVGSHRQFVLLARFLANNGITVFRFDYNGMGDSEGPLNDFYSALPDVDSALYEFRRQCPGVTQVALWGLCDAASVALAYIETQKDHAFINKLILLNPWVRQEKSKAQAVLKHYYLKKLSSLGFWVGLIKGRLNIVQSTRDFISNIKVALIKKDNHSSIQLKGKSEKIWPNLNADNYIDHMKQGLQSYDGELYLVMSGEDLTANEFDDLIKKDEKWSLLMKKKCMGRLNIKLANHTFSSQEYRSQVETFTLSTLLNNPS